MSVRVDRSILRHQAEPGKVAYGAFQVQMFLHFLEGPAVVAGKTLLDLIEILPADLNICLNRRFIVLCNLADLVDDIIRDRLIQLFDIKV